MAEIDGKQVVRSYTPTTLDDDKGHFDLVVKVSALTSQCWYAMMTSGMLSIWVIAVPEVNGQEC